MNDSRCGDADDTVVSRPGAWPNFLVIGASKCGTTSLWHYLDQHPSVYMSPVKEPMYFCSDDYVAAPGDRHYFMQEHAVRSPGDYLALFSQRSAEPMAGEATTAYIADPAAPARIHATLPDVKLVAVIRHPAERAYSEYAYSRAWGIETVPTFEQAIAAGARGWPTDAQVAPIRRARLLRSAARPVSRGVSEKPTPRVSLRAPFRRSAHRHARRVRLPRRRRHDRI